MSSHLKCKQLGKSNINVYAILRHAPSTCTEFWISERKRYLCTRFYDLLGALKLLMANEFRTIILPFCDNICLRFSVFTHFVYSRFGLIFSQSIIFYVSGLVSIWILSAWPEFSKKEIVESKNSFLIVSLKITYMAYDIILSAIMHIRTFVSLAYVY